MSTSDSTIPAQLLTTLDELAGVLNDRQINYALIGGLGAAMRGGLRATRDIDMLLEIPQVQLPPLLESLATRDFQCEMLSAIESWNRRHMLNLDKGSVQVDWIKAVLPMFQEILRRAKPEEVRGQRLRVADAEGLLLLKLIAFRPHDQEDMQAILAANRGAIDIDWVRSQWRSVATADDPRTEGFDRLVSEHYAS